MGENTCETCKHLKYNCFPIVGLCEENNKWEPMNKSEPTGTCKKVIDEVVMDLKARSDMGEKKYGTPLRTFNGRNAMMDLYQELLDSVMYAKQVLMEMEDK